MLRPETKEIQEQLAMYCRSGKETPIPGVTKGRLPHYRRLVYNVVHGTIAQAYPITRKVLTDEEWNYLFDSFFVEHDAQTPILWKLPYEFYSYAKEHSYDQKFDKLWLLELLWFEWLEIEVHMMQDAEHPEYSDSEDVMDDHLVVNRDSRLIQLEYPVHMHAVEVAEQKKGSHYVYIYRDVETGTVRFINLSVLHAWLLDHLMNNMTESATDLLPEMKSVFNLQGVADIDLQIEKFLLEMLDKGVILGSRN